MATENPYDVIVLDIMLPGPQRLPGLRAAPRRRELDADPHAHGQGRRVRPRRGARHRRRRLPHQAVLVRRAAGPAAARCCAAPAAPARSCTPPGTSPSIRSRTAAAAVTPTCRSPRASSRCSSSCCDAPGEVVSKGEILDNVWDFAFEGDPNIVEVYIRHLRRKLDEPFGKQLIETIRGAGLPPRSRGRLSRGAPAGDGPGAHHRRRGARGGRGAGRRRVLARAGAPQRAHHEHRDRPRACDRRTSRRPSATAPSRRCSRCPVATRTSCRWSTAAATSSRRREPPRSNPGSATCSPTPTATRRARSPVAEKGEGPYRVVARRVNDRRRAPYMVYVRRQPRGRRRQHRATSSGCSGGRCPRC